MRQGITLRTNSGPYQSEASTQRASCGIGIAPELRVNDGRCYGGVPQLISRQEYEFILTANGGVRLAGHSSVIPVTFPRIMRQYADDSQHSASRCCVEAEPVHEVRTHRNSTSSTIKGSIWTLPRD